MASKTAVLSIRIIGDGSHAARVMRQTSNLAGQIGAKALGIAALGAVALTSAANVVSLAVSLSMVALAGLALPGILGGIAVGGLALGLALSTAKTQLADLGPAFASVRTASGAGFWSQAEQPLRALVGSHLPAVSAGLAGVASAWGTLASTAIGALARMSPTGLTGMFDKVASSVLLLKPAIAPIIGALADLGQVGGEYLAPLTQGFTDVAVKIAGFVSAAASDGRLKTWIDTGIAAIGSLGSIIGSVLGIVTTLVQTMGGTLTIGVLAQGLEAANAALSGPVGRGILTEIFSTARESVAAMSPVLGLVGVLLKGLAPIFVQLMAAAGPLIGQLATGLTPIFAALLPVVGQLATSLLALVQPLAGLLLTALSAIMQIITPLLPVITGLVGQLVTGLTPILAQLGQIIAIVGVALAPVIEQLVTQFGPILTQLIGIILGLVSGLLAQLIPALDEILPVVGEVILLIANALGPTLSALMPIITILGEWISSTFGHILGVIKGVVEFVAGALSGDWDRAWKGAGEVVGHIGGFLKDTIKSVMGIVGEVIDNLGPKVWELGSNIVQGLIDGIRSGAGALWDAMTDLASGAWKAAKDFLGIASPSRLMRKLGNWTAEGGVLGIRDWLGKARAVGEQLGVALAQPATIPTPSFAGIPTTPTPPGDGGTTIIVHGALDPDAVAQQIADLLARLKRRKGDL